MLVLLSDEVRLRSLVSSFPTFCTDYTSALDPAVASTLPVHELGVNTEVVCDEQTQPLINAPRP